MLETSIRTLAASAEVMALKGDLDGASEAMDRALRIAHDATGPRERIAALIATAAGMAAVCPFDQALRAAGGIKRVEDRIAALGTVAGALARAGRPTTALTSLPEDDLSPTGLRALAEALVMAGDIDRAVTVAGRDPDPSWGWDAFTRALIRAGRLDHAYATALFLVTDRPRRGVALLLVAEALARSGRAGQAVEVAERIADPPCRSQALRAAALAPGDPQRTADLLRRAETAARAITNPGTRHTELGDLALAWAEHGDLDQALATADAIDLDSRRAAARVTLARRLIQSGRSGEAAAVLADTQPTDTDLLVTMAQAGRLDHAMSLAHTITDRVRRDQAIARVARAATGAGRPERAAEILDEAATAALAVDGDDDIRHIHALVDLADALVHAGRGERADDLLRRAELLVHTLYEEQEQSEARRLLASALARAGLLDRADAIAADHWPSPWPDLVRALCDLGAYDHAYERAPSIPDPSRRSQALHRIAAGHARNGRLDQAESIAQAIEEPAARAQALLAAAEARTRAGHLNQAAELLRTAETTARSVTSAHDHDRLLSDLVDALLAIGRLPQAADLLAHAEATADTPTTLAAVLTASGHLDRAFRTALDIPDPLEQCDTLASIAEAHARAGAPPGRVQQVLLHADATAVPPADPALRTRLRARVARARATTGDTHHAQQTLDDLLSSNTPMPREATADVAQALSTLGRHDHALTLAATDPRTSATVIVTLARTGATTRATTLAHGLPDPHLRAWTLAEISRTRATTGNPAEPT
ncbi:hypothetical protein [Nonomuraea sp. NPDC048826]|uniref:hypothetical protein n=1 Tax=Nonomuraea sp. NPDC048826 TaxID=3364347 RepID=UPI00371FC2D1